MMPLFRALAWRHREAALAPWCAARPVLRRALSQQNRHDWANV